MLGSQFVVPLKQCEPATYTSLQILDPARASYTDGTVRFADGDGNTIPGIGERAIDGSGTVDLSGLQLNTATGLPQFLITLNGGATASQVVLKLTWTGNDDPACSREGITVGQSAASPAQPQVVTAVAPSLKLPALRSCLSRRNFRIRIVSSRKDPVRKATVTVAGKRVKVVRRTLDGRRRFTADVNLGGKPPSTLAVRITATLRSGKVKKGTRRYRTCSRKLVGGRPKL